MKILFQDDESPLSAAKRGKESSMWKAIESQKKNKSDIVIISWKYRSFISNIKINLNTIEGIR